MQERARVCMCVQASVRLGVCLRFVKHVVIVLFIIKLMSVEYIKQYVVTNYRYKILHIITNTFWDISCLRICAIISSASGGISGC